MVNIKDVCTVGCVLNFSGVDFGLNNLYNGQIAEVFCIEILFGSHPRTILRINSGVNKGDLCVVKLRMRNSVKIACLKET